MAGEVRYASVQCEGPAEDATPTQSRGEFCCAGDGEFILASPQSVHKPAKAQSDAVEDSLACKSCRTMGE